MLRVTAKRLADSTAKVFKQLNPRPYINWHDDYARKFAEEGPRAKEEQRKEYETTYGTEPISFNPESSMFPYPAAFAFFWVVFMLYNVYDDPNAPPYDEINASFCLGTNPDGTTKVFREPVNAHPFFADNIEIK
eukprot:Sspe_Gene.31245::Locus_15424_Transcript_1_1_Confidence_1.000_Length_506::g.31245::m.31245